MLSIKLKISILFIIALFMPFTHILKFKMIVFQLVKLQQNNIVNKISVPQIII